ncbi:MAG: hypothetical protein HC788_12630 [Sphingopyxis sp.]|nr:hypothetical protein [Sphingopyxis sp.]
MADADVRYIKVRDAFLRSQPDAKSKSANHLLLGDWLRVTGRPQTAGYRFARAAMTGFCWKRRLAPPARWR